MTWSTVCTASEASGGATANWGVMVKVTDNNNGTATLEWVYQAWVSPETSGYKRTIYAANTWMKLDGTQVAKLSANKTVVGGSPIIVKDGSKTYTLSSTPTTAKIKISGEGMTTKTASATVDLPAYNPPAPDPGVQATVTYDGNGGTFQDARGGGATLVRNAWGIKDVHAPNSATTAAQAAVTWGTDAPLLRINEASNGNLDAAKTWNTDPNGNGDVFKPTDSWWYTLQGTIDQADDINHTFCSYDLVARDQTFINGDVDPADCYNGTAGYSERLKGGNGGSTALSSSINSGTFTGNIVGWSKKDWAAGTSLSQIYWFLDYSVTEEVGDDLNTITYTPTIYCDAPSLNNTEQVPDWRYISDAKPKFTFTIVNDDGGPVYQSTVTRTVSTPTGHDGWTNVGGTSTTLSTKAKWGHKSQCGAKAPIKTQFKVYPGMKYTVTPKITCTGSYPWFAGTGTFPKFHFQAGCRNTYPSTQMYAIWKNVVIITPPEIQNDVEYSGDLYDTLKNPGSVENGEIQYSLDGTSGWTAEVPTKENVGSYDVYWKVVPDSGYSFKPGEEVYGTAQKVGTFNITKRPITIHAKDDTAVYDNTKHALSEGEITVGTLADGQVITYSDFAEGVDAGDYTKEPSATINKADGTNTTDNYEITKLPGTLTITKRPITIKFKDGTSVYGDDSTQAVELKTGTLATGDKLLDKTKVTAGPYVGTYNLTPTTANYVIKQGTTALAPVVTSNYDVTVEANTWTITKRPITIKANDATKVYDGTALTTTAALASGTLVTGETATYSSASTITDVGTEVAVPKVVIKDALGLVTTTNYEVTKTNGTLEVTKKQIAIPTVSGEYKFDGAEHSGVVAGLDTAYVTQGGTDKATAAGVYTITFDLKDTKNTEWTDKTVAQKSGTWKIKFDGVPIPTIDPTSFVYDGTAKKPTEKGLDTTRVTSTIAEQTNVGTYTVTYKLKDASDFWEDGTQADKTYTWEITKRQITIPTVSGEYTFDTATHSATIAGFDGAYTNQTGTSSTAVAETYTLTYTLKDTDNTEWTDGSITAKTGSWKINKRQITIPTVSGEYTYDGLSHSGTITGYDATYVTKTGTETSIAANDYEIKFDLTYPASTTWTDNTTTQKSGVWKIVFDGVKIPYLDPTSYTYDKTAKKPTEKDLDTTKVNSTLTERTDAGTYTVTYTLKDSTLFWTDGTQEPKTKTWTIEKRKITIPTVSGEYEFNNTTKNAVITNPDADYVTKSGTESETAASEYTVKFDLADNKNTTWTDGTITQKTGTWKINKKKIAVPSVSGEYPYDGASHSAVVTGLDSDYVTQTGTDTETEAKVYTLTFNLKYPASTTWTDGSTAAQTGTWKIKFDGVTIPTITPTTFVYDGTKKKPTEKDYDATKVTSTITEQTDVGTYTVTYSLIDPTAFWEDKTQDAKSYTWNITKRQLAIPTCTGSYTYDTTTKSATIAGFDTATMIQSGDSSAINAKTYTVKWDIKDTANNEWTDGTITQKSGTWEILKADCNVSAPASATTSVGVAGNATITTHADATVTVTGGDATIATYTYDAATKTITFTGVKEGTTTLTINCAETDNYKAGSTTINIIISASLKRTITYWTRKADGTAVKLGEQEVDDYNGNFTTYTLDDLDVDPTTVLPGWAYPTKSLTDFWAIGDELYQDKATNSLNKGTEYNYKTSLGSSNADLYLIASVDWIWYKVPGSNQGALPWNTKLSKFAIKVDDSTSSKYTFYGWKWHGDTSFAETGYLANLSDVGTYLTINTSDVTGDRVVSNKVAFSALASRQIAVVYDTDGGTPAIADDQRKQYVLGHSSRPLVDRVSWTIATAPTKTDFVFNNWKDTKNIGHNPGETYSASPAATVPAPSDAKFDDTKGYWIHTTMTAQWTLGAGHIWKKISGVWYKGIAWKRISGTFQKNKSVYHKSGGTWNKGA